MESCVHWRLCSGAGIEVGLVVVALIVPAVSEFCHDTKNAAVRCIQRPTFWFPGQQARTMIETPPDCGVVELK